MHVTTSDLAVFGGSKTFTFRGIMGTTPTRRDLADAEPHTARGPAPEPLDESRRAASAGGRLDLVRGVVEQIVGRSLRAADIDAIASHVQPVALAFDQARKVEALERARDGRAQAERARAQADGAPTGAVSWNATLELRETVSGDGAFAVTGSLTMSDGREVAIEVRLVGDGDGAVLPLLVDVDLGPDGAPVRLGFSGRAVGAAGAAGTREAATAAAWAGLPVRVRDAGGGMTVGALADLRLTQGAGFALGGGSGHIDLVA